MTVNTARLNTRFAAVLSVILGVVALVSCASNDELFARYDQFCSKKICIAGVSEVQFTELPPEYSLWEPAVYFGFDKHHLVAAEYSRIERNVQVLDQHPQFKVSIRGFTDSFNTQAYNLALADRRQTTVVEYLKSRGIDPNRIIASKAGELLPIIDSDAEQDRILNRRVEMLLLDETGRPLAFGVDLDRRANDVFVAPTPTDREPRR